MVDVLGDSDIFIAVNRKLKSDNYVSMHSSFHMCRPNMSGTLWLSSSLLLSCQSNGSANLIKNYSIWCIIFAHAATVYCQLPDALNTNDMAHRELHVNDASLL